MTKLQIVMGYL